VGKQLTSAFHTVAALRKEFPGGLKEVRDLKAQLAQIQEAGATGEALQELSGFREYDRQFMEADPRFVDTMALADSAAFQKLVPHIFSRYAEMNGEGWGSMVAAAIHSDMERVGLPVKVALLGHFLEEMASDASNPVASKALAHFKTLDEYLGGVRSAAVRPVVVASKEKEPEPTGNRETELVQELWNVDIDKMLTSKYNTEFARIAGGRNIPEEARLEIEELFRTRWDQAMKSVPQFQAKVHGFLKTGDREGNKRYFGSLAQEHTGRILEALMRRHISQSPAPKAAPKPAAAAPATPATPGVSRVQGIPDRSLIDMTRTDSDMLRSGKAIMKDGRTVQWR
jgi:hypothetical protein